jgi:predicted PurR-regulated permease PerM
VSFERHLLYWLAALAGLWLLLQQLGGALAPFVLGIALGYLLDPLARRLARTGIGRLGASLVILGAFVIFFAAMLVLVAPILARQLVEFAETLPATINRLQALAVGEGNVLIEKYGGLWSDWFGTTTPLSPELIQKSVGDMVAQGAQWLLDNARSVVSGSKGLLTFVSFLVVTPVVAFYILVDWDKMIATIDSWLPIDQREELRSIAREIDAALAGFLRGQSLVCLFLGLWYGIGLSLIGLNFGFLIGSTAGVLSFVPYIGSLTALLVSLIVSIVQGWPNWSLTIEAMAVVGAGQFLEGNVLSPKLVGESVGLHPVWVMFALVAFGALFGFTGLIVAVPVAAALGVIVRHLLRRYRRSPFYLGDASVLIAPERADDEIGTLR